MTARPCNEWSFQYLIGFTPYHLNIPCCDTFTYWVGLYQKDIVASELDADDWLADMSWQFESEEQASRVEDLYGNIDRVPGIFMPVAPVTMAKCWSPFPLICSRLGEPEYSRLSDELGKGLALWKPKEQWQTCDKQPRDVAHCEIIMAAATRRAIQENLAILVCGSPGWSYDNDWLAGNKRVAKLMSKCGFVVTSRRPKGKE